MLHPESFVSANNKISIETSAGNQKLQKIISKQISEVSARRLKQNAQYSKQGLSASVGASFVVQLLIAGSM